MILYALQCAQGHLFESWFPSSSSYESQRARELVSCPHCGSTAVEKAVMAPSVARTDKPRPPEPAAPSAAMPDAGGPTAGDSRAEGVAPDPLAGPPPASEETALTVMSQPEAELRELMRKLRDHVVKSSDYVGADFADLARKMHDGEMEHRAIYGEATADEVKALHEEEIEILPLPVLPEDRN